MANLRAASPLHEPYKLRSDYQSMTHRCAGRTEIDGIPHEGWGSICATGAGLDWIGAGKPAWQNTAKRWPDYLAFCRPQLPIGI